VPLIPGAGIQPVRLSGGFFGSETDGRKVYTCTVLVRA